MNLQELKDLRVSIDSNIKKTDQLRGKTGRNGEIVASGAREMALVKTKLQEAKMWVGKVLEENNSPLPEEFRDEAK